MEVTRDTFKGSDNGTQNLILFDSMMSLGEKLDSFNSSCENKHLKIETDIRRSGRINKATSAGSGFFGGFMAIIGSKFFGL
jgi:hypothetical protein